MVSENDAAVDGVTKAGKVYVFELGAPAPSQPAQVEEPVEISAEPEQEPKNSGGIPGFPVESVIISLALAVLILYLALRQQ